MSPAIPTTTLMLPAPADPVGDKLGTVFARLKESTRRFYGDALDDFSKYVGTADRAAAARLLFSLPHGDANELAEKYQTYLLSDSHLAASTIASRMGALAGITKRMRRLGVIPWKLEFDKVKSRGYRDTAGPGTANVVAMMGAAQDGTALGARDGAILALLFDVALRRGEVASLDFEDVDFSASRISIRGKGRDDDEWVTLPAATLSALVEWIRHRGTLPGPLFCNLDRANARTRLSTTGLYLAVQRAAEKIGIETHPHALRHAGVTEAAKELGNDSASLSAFARHRNTTTTLKYIDNLKDRAGQVANRVAAAREKR